MTPEFISAAVSEETTTAVVTSIAGLVSAIAGLIMSFIGIRELRRRNPRDDMQLRYEDEKGDEHLIVIRDDEGRDTIEKFIDSISKAHGKSRQAQAESAKVSRISTSRGGRLRLNRRRQKDRHKNW